jgi:probable rRNA maturation factor
MNHPSRCRVQVLNRQRLFKISSGAVASLCVEVLDRLEQSRNLSVVFVGPRAMRSLNRNYRGRDYATDVLSFTYNEDEVEGKPFLGEVILAPAVAAERARRFGTNVESEMRRLLVHGILHLLGYDHEADRGEMIRLQARLMRVLCRTLHRVIRHES